MNKKKVLKVLACGTCACVLAGSLAVGIMEVPAKAEKTDEEIVSETKEALSNIIDTSSEESELVKDETVYVIADANGGVKKVIVSDWIKNGLSKANINDVSNLTDIENTKGDASYTINAENAKVWNANGEDIYYQGTTNNQLPVDLKITYMLDGKPVSADKIAGKSGKVTIRFEYVNNTKEVVEIDGEDTEMYVPFAMMTGLMLDDENFKNIDVTNGKIINDGNRTIVVGLAFPGLQEDLNIDSEKLDIPNYFEVTADAKDFSLGMTATIATNEVFNKLNLEEVDSMDELYDSLSELTDAMDQLLDGSSKLYDGMCTLLDKSDELVAGVNAIADGAGSLKDGAIKLDNGAASLQGGASQLSTGLNTLTANNDKLNGGAKQVFDTLLAMANTQIKEAGLSVPELTIENYSETLSAVIAGLDENKVYEQALSQVSAGVDSLGDSLYATYVDSIADSVYATYIDSIENDVYMQAVLPSVKAMLLTNGVPEEQIGVYLSSEEGMQVLEGAVAGLIDEQKAQIKAGAIAGLTDEQKTQIKAGAVATLTDEQKAQIRQGAIDKTMASEEVQAKLVEASEGVKKLAALKGQLDSYNEFYRGLAEYTNGVKSCADGANSLKGGCDSLKAGTGDLSAGAAKLYDGALQLKNGMPALVDGINQLKDGSMKLNDGLSQFNEEGVQKIVEAADGDALNLIDRLKATVNVSKNYKTFSGISDDMLGQVKFIYRTDSIE